MVVLLYRRVFVDDLWKDSPKVTLQVVFLLFHPYNFVRRLENEDDSQLAC